jgi:hypothetical protein
MLVEALQPQDKTWPAQIRPSRDECDLVQSPYCEAISETCVVHTTAFTPESRLQIVLAQPPGVDEP